MLKIRKNLSRRELKHEKKKHMSEDIRCNIEGILIIIFLAIFFYRSIWAVPFLIPVFLIYRREKRSNLLIRRRRAIQIQFKDAILSISANQKVGYSIENSFRRAYDDMILLYGKNSMICRELYMIALGLGNNIILEKLLYDFGKRSQTEDIIEFAEVFAVAKRNGGNMTEIIERSVTVIEEKVETEKEIQILLASRQMEQKIMNVIPFGILLYISITSRGFFDVLYHNPPGVILMTICLFIYLGAVLLSRKIVTIEV